MVSVSFQPRSELLRIVHIDRYRWCIGADFGQMLGRLVCVVCVCEYVATSREPKGSERG